MRKDSRPLFSDRWVRAGIGGMGVEMGSASSFGMSDYKT
jgi:hypothetical protein